MSYARVSEADEAVNGATYRNVYFCGGSFPSNTVVGYATVAIEEFVKARYPGAAVQDVEFIDPIHSASIFGNVRPYNTWAVRITWKKISGNTPLLVFAALIAAAVLAAIVITGFVIVARFIEKQEQILGPNSPLFSPATVIAVIIVIAVIAGALKKGGT